MKVFFLAILFLISNYGVATSLDLPPGISLRDESSAYPAPTKVDTVYSFEPIDELLDNLADYPELYVSHPNVEVFLTDLMKIIIALESLHVPQRVINLYISAHTRMDAALKIKRMSCEEHVSLVKNNPPHPSQE